MDEEVLEDFSKLSENDLRDISLGVSQIKQAKSYTLEYLSPDGKYDFSIHKEDQGLILVEISLDIHLPSHTSYGSYIILGLEQAALPAVLPV